MYAVGKACLLVRLVTNQCSLFNHSLECNAVHECIRTSVLNIKKLIKHRELVCSTVFNF